jgi:hypothetical protein
LKGYIWIGNYNQTWTSPQLAQPETGKPMSVSPNQFKTGEEYIVLGNLVVRDGLPANDESYYRGRKSLGVIPQGTRIRLINGPVPIDRQFAVQYWAEVQVL